MTGVLGAMGFQAVVGAPSGPAFTVVLGLHVASALFVIVTLVAGGVASARLLAARGRALPASVRTYFSPGRNWAGRALWLVPALGAAVLAMSGDAYSITQSWVLTGIGLWAGAIALCEGVVWPAEQSVRRSLADLEGPPVPPETVRACATVCVATSAALTLILTALIVMIAKP